MSSNINFALPGNYERRGLLLEEEPEAFPKASSCCQAATT